MIGRRQRFNAKTLEVVTPQIGDAVSLADLKAYLVISGTDEDALLTRFLVQAQQGVQNYLRRAIQEQTLDYWMDAFPSSDDDAIVSLGSGVHDYPASYITGGSDAISLPLPPVATITSVKTYDRANAESTLDSAAYTLDGPRARLILNSGYSWPTGLRDYRGVVVRYVAGYTDIPAPIIAGITAYAARLYECRGVCGMPEQCTMLIDPYKIRDYLA